jgi:cytochrome P450
LTASDYRAEAASLLDTTDAEPWDYYERLVERGEVVWDDGMNGWVVPTYTGCKEVLSNDKRLVHHPGEDTPADGPYRLFSGPMLTTMMTGEFHTKVHNAWLQLFHPREVESWRAPLIRPVIDRTIDRFVDRGRVELAAELVEPIPVRVIAAVLGLDWRDDELIDEYKALLDWKMRWIDRVGATHGASGSPGSEDERRELTAKMFEVSARMAEMLTPTIEARRDRREDDLISKLWDVGPTLVDGFEVEHVNSALFNLFFGGTDTTTHAICNGLHMLLEQPDLGPRVLNGGPKTLAVFAEEVLRLAGSVQFRTRIANSDFELDGVQIKQGQVVIPAILAANRDPRRHGCPLEVDLEREAPQGHMAFNFGPRYCIGAALARAEIQEVLHAALVRLPNLRRDPDGEAASFKGFVLRSYRPLDALFDAETR